MIVYTMYDGIELPKKAHAGDLGYDLQSAEDVTVNPGQVVTIPTGIKIQFPVGWGAIIKDRSSMATKRKLITIAGVIDSNYRGEIKVALYNIGNEVQHIKRGDRIAQLIMYPAISVTQMEQICSETRWKAILDTEQHNTRLDGGFGSTGV